MLRVGRTRPRIRPYRGFMSADVQATFCATLVDEWARLGVQHAVVAPGSRSTPMALALAAHRSVHVSVFHDERSAAFAALGIGVASGRPSVLLCTSGTAAAHFLAPVLEADQSGVPMLVLTADRPPELQHVGAPQTIDQTELYGNAVRWFHDPGVPSAEGMGAWRTLAREAHSATLAAGNPGPVHLNLPFREPLVGEARELPPLLDEQFGDQLDDHVDRGQVDVAAALRLLDVTRGIIVVGRGASAAEVASLAATLEWPVLADPRSGCRHLPQAISAFDSLLRDKAFAAAHRPQAVLQLGEPPASKVLGEWLQIADSPHVQVHAQPRVIDPLGIVDLRLVASPAAVCGQLEVLPGAAGTAWLQEWVSAERRAQRAIADVLAREAVLSEPAVARVLTSDGMPSGAQLVVSSSMPIRDVEWFGAGAVGVTVHSNRGVNGIDGVIATGIGVALATGAPTVVLLGDVAFCHDASSLTALAGRDLQLAIVVVDNDGGGIFSFLPQATTLSPARFEQLFGTPHGTDVLALAAAHGLRTCTAIGAAELLAAVAQPGLAVIRVVSDRSANVAMHDRLHVAVASTL